MLIDGNSAFFSIGLVAVTVQARLGQQVGAAPSIIFNSPFWMRALTAAMPGREHSCRDGRSSRHFQLGPSIGAGRIGAPGDPRGKRAAW